MTRVVIAYDIGDPKVRARIHRRLHDFGHPVGLSVFELDLHRSGLDDLWRQLTAMATGNRDRLVAYPLCDRCHGGRRHHGDALTPLPVGGVLVVEDPPEVPLPPSDPDDYSLFAQVIDRTNLHAAWRRVRANRGGPGSDGVTVPRFADRLARELRLLHSQLASGDYRPRPIRYRRIRKRNGGTRTLSIPAVRDRIAQTALTRRLQPLWENELSPASFAYRPRRSVHQALARIERLRRRGHTWVVVADIDDFFDNIDHDILFHFLDEFIDDDRVIDMVRLWLSADTDGKGVAQGSPIAPLLSNIYLDIFDDQLLRDGYGLVRYADDLVICCKTDTDARRALDQTISSLKNLGLTLNDGARITNFSEGFEYLGRYLVGSLNLPGETARAAGRPRWNIATRSSERG